MRNVLADTFRCVVYALLFVTAFYVAELWALDPVVWDESSAVNVAISGNDVSKAGSGFNGVARSVQTFSSDVELDVRIPDNTTKKMIGLSSTFAGPCNQQTCWNHMEYVIYASDNGTFRVYESGVNQGTFGSYQPGDRFQIERSGITVLYSHNGQPFRVIGVGSLPPLFAHVALSTGGAVEDAQIGMFGASPELVFQAIPATIAALPGQQTELFWDANNADICMASGPGGGKPTPWTSSTETMGFAMITPSAGEVYGMLCSNDIGDVEKQVRWTVTITGVEETVE